ncbi:unnamed protein product [Caenorhabditis brenneri]
MTETPELTIYEKTFAKSDKTDAILLVDGKKLHVNKALLSYHSEYFSALFNSDFKEKSIEEVEIKDVNFEDFATILSLIQPNPIFPTEENAGRLLELADRFLLHSAKRQLEMFILAPKISSVQKLKLADKYCSDIVTEHALELFTSPGDLIGLGKIEELSDTTKARIFDRIYKIQEKVLAPPFSFRRFGE